MSSNLTGGTPNERKVSNMPHADQDVETEYWTKDAEGNGYCSCFSLEDALRGHFLDMQVKINPLGPIVNVVVIRRKKIVTETVTEFWEDRNA